MPPPQQVLHHLSDSLLRVARPSSTEDFWDHRSTMPRGPSNPCPLLPNKIGGIMLFWSVLNCAGWETDIPWGDGTILLESRPFNYPLCLLPGYYQLWNRSHSRNEIITACRVPGKTRLEDVWFYIYTTKFLSMNLTWPRKWIIIHIFLQIGRNICICGQLKAW